MQQIQQLSNHDYAQEMHRRQPALR